jgi:hypothetical protein
MIISTMHVIFIFLVFIAAIALACYTECDWQCDNPTCGANCHPVCKQPICKVQCEIPHQVTHCSEPICHISCPIDQCTSDECPMCETICESLHCKHKSNVCSILCEETQCNWTCSTPINCPRPFCELQCEKPACESSLSSLTKSDANSLQLSIFLSYILMLCAFVF